MIPAQVMVCVPVLDQSAGLTLIVAGWLGGVVSGRRADTVAAVALPAVWPYALVGMTLK